ncbi:hypothetical protein H5410_015667 [Solanum commersonii]|uniref:G-patch domain-containing protein n=1 Tax=Solanum commersonii TaxID=4109 RepID=A0A9J5ZUS4_SOLCO|nr:hypothetical protein H5410_015667 [Solanum commersonii]
MSDKDEFNAAANIIVPFENLESSRSIVDIPNEEKMAHMEQELEILREELRQVRDLAKLQFPPASPTAVRIVPDLSNRDSTIPTVQQILGAHVAASYEPHIPPIYAAGVPIFTTPVVVNILTEVARVQPPLDESELSKYFIRGQEGIYFDKMMSMMAQKFVELVKMGDFIEEASIHQNRPAYAPRPRLNPEARNARAYTPIAEPYAQLFERLRTAGVLQPVEGKLPDTIPHNFDGNKRCAYHSGVQGHDTEDCYGLKNQIESLIKRGVIKCTPTPPNVNNNPLPNHENREVNMVTLDDKYGTPNYPNIDEADAMTSSAQPVITVQLREPLTVQTYLPRVVVTTLVAKKPEYDTKAVPWDYRANGATFHTLEIMQAIRFNEEAEAGNTKLSSTTKMVASEMLKYGYQPKSGLGPKCNGIVEPIQLKHQRGTNGLDTSLP